MSMLFEVLLCYGCICEFASWNVLAANSIFWLLLKNDAYTPCLITTIHCRIVLLDICFMSATITIWFRLSFHNWKCENTSFIVWTIVVFDQCFWKTLDHQFIAWLQKDFFKLMSFSILLPWLRIWISLITKPLSMKIY